MEFPDRSARFERQFSSTNTGAVLPLSECGFIQTEEPYWLNEAYAKALVAADIGVIKEICELGGHLRRDFLALS